MTHRLNYSSQALEAMHVLGEMPWISNEKLAIETAKCVRDIMVMLDKAEKFILPEWGRIFNGKEWEMVCDQRFPTRLPYPVVALEYPCTYTMGTDHLIAKKELASSKRIALAVETEAILALAPDYLGPMVEKSPLPPGFWVFPISWSDDANVWTPPPSCMYFPRGGNNDIKFLRRDQFVHVLPLGEDAYSYYPKEEHQLRAASDVADEALAVMHLLIALSLDKGRHETLPAPEKLNRKRAKRKKPPLFEYKVLDIVADVLSPPKEVIHGREGHHHASPRMHTRRGHVRKLASGKATWIRNAIVGKPKRGEVIKQYAVHD
jgi:hypothetical protein